MSLLLVFKIFLGIRLSCSKKLAKHPYRIYGLETLSCAMYYSSNNEMLYTFMSSTTLFYVYPFRAFRDLIAHEPVRTIKQIRDDTISMTSAYAGFIVYFQLVSLSLWLTSIALVYSDLLMMLSNPFRNVTFRLKYYYMILGSMIVLFTGSFFIRNDSFFPYDNYVGYGVEGLAVIAILVLGVGVLRVIYKSDSQSWGNVKDKLRILYQWHFIGFVLQMSLIWVARYFEIRMVGEMDNRKYMHHLEVYKGRKKKMVGLISGAGIISCLADIVRL